MEASALPMLNASDTNGKTTVQVRWIMKSVLVLVLALSLSLFCVPQAQAFIAGGDVSHDAQAYLDDKMGRPAEEWRVMYFVGLTAGFRDGLTVCKQFLIPDGATADKTTLIFAKYLVAHPEQWHIAAVKLYQMALEDAYPPKQ